MNPDAAAALVSGIGLRNLVTRHADTLARYSTALTVSAERVEVPGGAEAERVWTKLAGASPRNPPVFLRALFEKDQGRLAAFYEALSRGDLSRQRFFTRTELTAESFYAGYRDSAEFRGGVARHVPGWRTALFQNLPMKAGAAQFPGGPQAWDQNHPDSWEALEPIARLDAHRGTPLDADSVRILIAHYSAWRTLFPCFEKLPGLDHRHFADLAEFSAAVGKLPAADQNIAVGEWDSLLEVITRGSVSGYLDPAASADAFRSMCTTLAVADPSPAARNILARIVRPGDLDEAVPAWLLGLKGARRAAYDRVMQLQHVPRLAALARSPNETLAALSGIVYAATLDPDGLLVNENRQLLRRHRFAESSPFSVASLAHSPDGSYFRGGFSNFSEVARSLAPGGRERSADPNAPLDTAPSGPLEAGSFEVDPSAVVFRAAAKLVEVPVTVTDSSGRFVDDLSRSDFTLFDQGKPQSLVAFESRAAEVSVALLLDTTGSMHAALPTFKNAALRLIAGLRPADRVAV